MEAARAPGARELDELTLRRAQRGEAAAFRALVETYQARVWELCWRMLAPVGLGHRAEDVSQETFVRVFRALAGFDPGGAARLSTWILTIATRRALSELARVRPRAPGDEQVLAALEAASVDGGARAGDGSARRELGERLAEAIGALPDGARAVLLLRDLYDLDYAEIARALDLDLGTVKSRLARARAAVRA
ncbi:MAG TPA: sigma-70 family RNA polymerase sigma factor, partial [Kofleriaceae bacterium]|nr:sigma-70 family RNA polymerase sigma factor [Kofleriaceae bacterium]